jgi:hypothetical protein
MRIRLLYAVQYNGRHLAEGEAHEVDEKFGRALLAERRALLAPAPETIEHRDPVPARARGR